MYTSVY